MRVDLPRWLYFYGWWMWLAYFAVLETLAILDPKQGDTLTENIRPIFHAHPLTWFLAAGFIVWLVIHFLVPVVEVWLTTHIEPWR